MKPDDENIQTFTAMFEGFAQAVLRFEAAVNRGGPTETFVALFEALNWAVALDDRTRKHWSPEGKSLGWEWRERVLGAEIMRGVRFARNQVHHQWSDALEATPGAQLPRALPFPLGEWRWRSASDLPEPNQPDPDGEAVYQEQLQGQPARITLQQLANVFNFLRKVMEPWATPQLPVGGGAG
jgi:hypothetical protein